MSLTYNRKITLPGLVCFIGLIGCFDFLVGFKISLYPLYLIPLLIIAWNEKVVVTLGVAALASVSVAIKYFLFEPLFVFEYHRYWDGSIKIALLFLISYSGLRIKQLVQEKESINEELRHALSEIQELREMVPICAWCHSIRNDAGFYEKIEVYLGQRTGANFTHGICPACKDKYYGSLFDKPPEDT